MQWGILLADKPLIISWILNDAGINSYGRMSPSLRAVGTCKR